MGYNTEFTGHITVAPPLNEVERAYLHKFARSRRMDREAGPYYVDGRYYDPFDRSGWQEDSDVRDAGRPPTGQPGLFCQWEPTEDGGGIEWNREEKFSDAVEWMRYLIDHFLKPGGEAQGQPGFEGFGFDHVLNGVIDAEGEEGEQWQLVVLENVVSVAGPDFGEPEWMCEGCLRTVESEEEPCCTGAANMLVWPA